VRFRKSKNCSKIIVRSFVKFGPGSWPVYFLLVPTMSHVFVPRLRRQLKHNLLYAGVILYLLLICVAVTPLVAL